MLSLFQLSSNLFLQVYQIINSDFEDSKIYLAGSSLSTLIQMEEELKVFASSLNADEYNDKFEDLVDEALKNYKQFLITPCDGDRMKCDMITNFKEFFNKCIDIKKEELVKMAKGDTDDGEPSTNQ